MSVKIDWDEIDFEDTTLHDTETVKYDRRYYPLSDMDVTPLLNEEPYTEMRPIHTDNHCHWKVKRSQKEPVSQLVTAIILCFAFMICEIVGGYLAGSLAIMCDAAHLLSDCASFILALLAFYIAKHPPDSKMTYGYRRAEVLGAMASVLLIWLLTGIFVYVAALRLYHGDFEIEADTMIWVSAAGVLVNIIMALVLHGSCIKVGHLHSHGDAVPQKHSNSLTLESIESDPVTSDGHHHTNGVNFHIHKDFVDVTSDTRHVSSHGGGNKANEKSINLRAALIHVLGDLIQSTGVLVASVVLKFFPSAKIIDPICTFVFSILVLCTTQRVVKEAYYVLMEGVPVNYSVKKVVSLLQTVQGVRSVHTVHIWGLTNTHVILTAHVVIDATADAEVILRECIEISRDKLGVSQATIQVEHRDSASLTCRECTND